MVLWFGNVSSILGLRKIYGTYICIDRIEFLESTLQEKEKQLSEERGRFQKLKEDFKYNLKLLGERDQELDRYDTTFTGKINAK